MPSFRLNSWRRERVAAVAALSASCDFGAEGEPSGSSLGWLLWVRRLEPGASGSRSRAGCCEEDRVERRQEEERRGGAAPAGRARDWRRCLRVPCGSRARHARQVALELQLKVPQTLQGIAASKPDMLGGIPPRTVERDGPGRPRRKQKA